MSDSYVLVSFFALGCFYLVLLPGAIIRNCSLSTSDFGKKGKQTYILRCLLTTICCFLSLRFLGFVTATMILSGMTQNTLLTEEELTLLNDEIANSQQSYWLPPEIPGLSVVNEIPEVLVLSIAVPEAFIILCYIYMIWLTTVFNIH